MNTLFSDNSVRNFVYTNILCFIGTWFIDVPYGKFSDQYTIGFNPTYAWYLMELPNIVCSLLFLIRGNVISHNILGWYMFTLYAIMRGFVYPRYLVNSNKTTVWWVVLFGMIFTSWNSYNQYRSWLDPNPNPIVLIRLLGILLFHVGYITNFVCDYHLTHNKQKFQRYVLPNLYFFRYISGANYFAELTQWFGYSLALQSGAAWAFYIGSLSNLVPRMYRTHFFYKEKWPLSMEGRKMWIPFVL